MNCRIKKLNKKLNKLTIFTIYYFIMDIYKACINNDISYIKDYIKNNDNLDIPDIMYDSTCIMFAAENGHEELCQLLIDSKASINHISKNKFNLMHFASIGGCLRILKYLNIINNTFLNKQGNNDETPLIAACRKNNTKSALCLIKMKANVNAQDNKGNTALIYASKFNNIEIISRLIKNKADLNKQNCYLDTALTMACFANNTITAQKLIESGADLNIRDNKKCSACSYACNNKNIEIIKTMLSTNNIQITINTKKSIVSMLIDLSPNLAVLDNFGIGVMLNSVKVE